MAVWAGLWWAGPACGAAVVFEAESAPIRTGGNPIANGWNLCVSGEVGGYVRLPRPGRFEVRVRAAGEPLGGVWPRMTVAVDHEPAAEAVSVTGRRWADYAFTLTLPAGTHALSAMFLNDAFTGREDRNLLLDRIAVAAVEGGPSPQVASAADLADEAERREQEALRRADANIEKRRKADAEVRVVRAGRPVADAHVTVEQTRHAFLFGCNIYAFDRFPTERENAEYKRRFADLFNYATIGFYWRSYEPERGKPHYAYTDKVVAWCQAHGIRMKGHPLLWGHRAGVPVWSDGQPPPEVQKVRVQAIIGRYRGRITFWEVVNEPTHCRQVPVDGPYRWAREADPSAHLILNDYHIFVDGNPTFLAFLKEKTAAGVPFDGIGIQAHEPRSMWFPIDRVQRILDRYAALGKAIHLTEFTPPSSGKPVKGSPGRGRWTEQVQAEYAERFYRVCFGHPAVVAITWWDLCDRFSWLPGGGLLRKDLSPKPAYQRLKRLIHGEWTTRTDGPTDRTGTLRFRGFLGTYRVTVEHGGKRTQATFDLTRKGPNVWTVALE